MKKQCRVCGRRGSRRFANAPGGRWICGDLVACLKRRGPACGDPYDRREQCRRRAGHAGDHLGWMHFWSRIIPAEN